MSTDPPYPTLLGHVEVRVLRATVDRKPLPLSLISQHEQVLSFHQAGRDNWREGVIELEVTLPQDELTESPWTSVGCVAILTERATHTRVVSRLERGTGEGPWRGEVRVLRFMHLRRATLEVNVVGGYGGVDGRIIGVGEMPWFVDLLEPAPIRQPEIDVVKVDFRAEGQERLRPFKDAPWLIDTDPYMPRVLLNTSFEGVADLLGAPRGPLEKALAGVVASQIAGEAWTVMFHCALAELEFDEDGTPRLPGGWKEPVLRTMLPDILSGRPLEDALFEVHSRRTEGRGWAELQPRIQFAAAQRAANSRNLTNAIRAVARAQEGRAR
ncbi:hypothetical protein ACIOC1_00015 [Streptomyces sp. NPDC088197]|uniref:hypothetical protein n=1 Tax=unclassified Streptomyces TaxID=2593676 RepID=UPI00380A80D6